VTRMTATDASCRLPAARGADRAPENSLCPGHGAANIKAETDEKQADARESFAGRGRNDDPSEARGRAPAHPRSTLRAVKQVGTAWELGRDKERIRPAPSMLRE